MAQCPPRSGQLSVGSNYYCNLTPRVPEQSKRLATKPPCPPPPLSSVGCAGRAVRSRVTPLIQTCLGPPQGRRCRVAERRKPKRRAGDRGGCPVSAMRFRRRKGKGARRKVSRARSLTPRRRHQLAAPRPRLLDRLRHFSTNQVKIRTENGLRRPCVAPQRVSTCLYTADIGSDGGIACTFLLWCRDRGNR